MPDAPLSRRARRTFEEEAADRAASQDPTLAFPSGFASGASGAADSDGVAVSRRDRRRMERLAHPLEAWTAEEEMIATGQIPAMTPERIAEQERISRDKAEKAAREAAAASQEFRRLAESEVGRAPEPAFGEPVFEAPAVQVPAPTQRWAEELPEVFQGEPAAHAAAEPSWSEQPDAGLQPPLFAAPETEVAEAPTATVDAEEPSHASDASAQPGRPTLEPYRPHMILDDAPLVHVAEPAPVSLPSVEPVHHETPIVPEPVTPVEAVAEHPNIFDELFPPGSSQAMLRQQDPFVAVSHEEPTASDSGQVPMLLPPQEVPVRELSPVEEMRRLAEEAMIGIERAAKADEAAAAAAAAAASAEAEAMSEFSWATQGDANPVVSQAEANPTFDSVPHVPQTANNGPATPPGGLAPHQAGFDQLARPASGQFPMPGQQGQPASGQFPMPGQAESPQGWPPAPQGLAAPMGPAWNSQPVNPPSGNVADPNDFTPLSDVPKPDFSGLFQPGQQAAFPPASGGMNVSGFNPTDPSSTGQVPSIRRPDLPEVGGAKHFKWLHLAVIGALMFVLGVVIYNAAFAQ